jgi:hypothetical protein
MVKMNEFKPEEGDFFEGILLETCRDEERHITRPRVRPVELLPQWLRVEFPRDLREKYLMGTRFRADVHVRRKHFSDGTPKGDIYLRAENRSIRRVMEHTPAESLKAIRRSGTTSGRAYQYVRVGYPQPPAPKSFDELRALAYAAATDQVPAAHSDAWRRERSEIIGEYALLRSSGECEGCQKPAPFLRRNGKPYLEIHHIVALADGGSDHPSNVAAVCPNCHRRVTHAKDGIEYNLQIKHRVQEIEERLSQ